MAFPLTSAGHLMPVTCAFLGCRNVNMLTFLQCALLMAHPLAAHGCHCS
jgi:hypothetical protein